MSDPYKRYNPTYHYCGPGRPSGYFTIYTNNRNNRCCYYHDKSYIRFHKKHGYWPYYVNIKGDKELIKCLDDSDEAKLMKTIFQTKESFADEKLEKELMTNKRYKCDDDDKECYAANIGQDFNSGNAQLIKTKRYRLREKRRRPSKFFKQMMNFLNPKATWVDITFGTIPRTYAASPVDADVLFSGSTRYFINLMADYGSGVPLAQLEQNPYASFHAKGYSSNLVLAQAKEKRGIPLMFGETTSVDMNSNAMNEVNYISDYRRHIELTVTSRTPITVTIYKFICVDNSFFSPMALMGYDAADAETYPLTKPTVTPLYSTANYPTPITKGTVSTLATYNTGNATQQYEVFTSSGIQYVSMRDQQTLNRYWKLVEQKSYQVENDTIHYKMSKLRPRRICLGDYIVGNASTNVIAGNQELYAYKKGDFFVMASTLGKEVRDGVDRNLIAYSDYTLNMKSHVTCKFQRKLQFNSKIKYINPISTIGTNGKITAVTQSNQDAKVL